MLHAALLPAPVTRLLAQIVDTVFAAACVLPGALVLILGIVTEMRLTTILGVVGVLLGLAVALVVQVRLLRDGQTVGKRQFEMRIVHFPTLEPVTLGTAFGIRYVVAQGLLGAIPWVGGLYGIVNILFVFAEDHRCLHDRIASTVVVDDAAWQARHSDATADVFRDAS